MNTNRGIASSSTITANRGATSVAPQSPKPTPQPITQPQEVIPALVKVMQSVKTDTPEAKLNKTTISDGEGGRIEMTEEQQLGTIVGSVSDRVW